MIAAEREFNPGTAHEASTLLDAQFPHLRDAFGPRRTKREMLLDLLHRDGGATIEDIMAAAGWDRRTATSFRSAIGRAVQVIRIVRADGRAAYVATRLAA